MGMWYNTKRMEWWNFWKEFDKNKYSIDSNRWRMWKSNSGRESRKVENVWQKIRGIFFKA